MAENTFEQNFIHHWRRHRISALIDQDLPLRAPVSQICGKRLGKDITAFCIALLHCAPDCLITLVLHKLYKSARCVKQCPKCP